MRAFFTREMTKRVMSAENAPETAAEARSPGSEGVATPDAGEVKSERETCHEGQDAELRTDH